MKDYTITKEGEVYSLLKNKVLKPYNNGIGYRAVKLMVDGKRRQFYLHRLVAQAYIGDVDNLVVNHLDGNKANNNVANLEIVTQKENQKHAFRNKLLGGFISRHY